MKTLRLFWRLMYWRGDALPLDNLTANGDGLRWLGITAESYTQLFDNSIDNIFGWLGNTGKRDGTE